MLGHGANKNDNEPGARKRDDRDIKEWHFTVPPMRRRLEARIESEQRSRRLVRQSRQPEKAG
jgi:hypothetical protein